MSRKINIINLNENNFLKLLIGIGFVIMFILNPINTYGKKLKTDKELYDKYSNIWDNKLTNDQKILSYLIYRRAKYDNLAWTAVAIAFEESQFGKWETSANVRLNIKKLSSYVHSYDCGLFHINTKSLLKREKRLVDYYNHKEACTDLIHDRNYNYTNFLQEIRFWEKVHKGKGWRYIWGSYNAGHKSNLEYGRKIAIIIQVLKNKKDFMKNIKEMNNEI